MKKGIRIMDKKFVLKLLMVVFFSMSGIIMASTFVGEPPPTPAEIDDLITSGIAIPTRVQFENQGMGCSTFIWKKSEGDCRFYFTRDGKSFGEFRHDILLDGRYVWTRELFIAKSARNIDFLKDAKEIPFVYKLKQFRWKEGFWFESIIKWGLEIRARDGTVLKYLDKAEEKTSRVNITIVVPPDMINKDKEYYIIVYKHNVTKFEKAYYNSKITEGKGLWIQRKKVEDGKCEMTFEWTRESPELLYELHERFYIPEDATPFFIRTKCIASMIRPTGTSQGEVITFEPNQE
jgi:hypothetical protein